jgi:hypothetical protein
VASQRGRNAFPAQPPRMTQRAVTLRCGRLAITPSCRSCGHDPCLRVVSGNRRCADWRRRHRVGVLADDQGLVGDRPISAWRCPKSIEAWRGCLSDQLPVRSLIRREGRCRCNHLVDQLSPDPSLVSCTPHLLSTVLAKPNGAGVNGPGGARVINATTPSAAAASQKQSQKPSI